MISSRDSARIGALARRYGVARVWLFGSSARPGKAARDIDLAVEGVSPAVFFRFCGELMLSLSKPVDVIALEKPSKLAALIRREGVPIYGKPARKS